MSSATSLATTLANGLRTLVGAGTTKPKGYRVIDVELKERIHLSPSLARLVFTGDDIASSRTLAPDQRIKLFFPSADGTPPNLPKQGDWQAERRTMSEAQRPPMRTYTIRALRTHACEMEVDFVMHGVTGPASAWATHARPGDRLQMVVPNLAFSGDPGGYEWRPPAGTRNVLLIGDETALPALAGILEQLSVQASGLHVQAFIEVPGEADCLPLHLHPSIQLSWLPRDVLRCGHGEGMIHAARELSQLPQAQIDSARVKPLKNVDIEQQILWETAAPPGNTDFYAWIAGESAAVMNIRRYLISERGLDRRSLTLMGYWRLGRALD